MARVSRRGAGRSNAAYPMLGVRISAPFASHGSATTRVVRRALIATAAGLALADAAVVTLALPPILLELDTAVEGVAAVIGVYTAVLALGLPLSAALHGRATGAAGAVLFAAASLGCASASSLELLLVMRALQAMGGAALLVAAFAALDGAGRGRRVWVAAAVAGFAAGPALGGALTELFDWRAIFIAQAPVALAAVWAFGTARPAADRPAGGRGGAGDVPAGRAAGSGGADVPAGDRRSAGPGGAGDALAADRPAAGAAGILPAVSLALLSGALTAVVFLLVLLLISGWSVEPLAAAATVTVLPLAALMGARVPGPAATRAVAGCLLVAGGVGCLALLPEALPAWTLAPQALAGVGMGMALPALAGELLPERTRAQAAGLLSLRHAGITLALLALAPIVANDLDQSIAVARERGTALILDARLLPTDKIELAPRLLADIESEDPRDALARALRRERRRIEREDGLTGGLREQLGSGADGLLDDLSGLEDDLRGRPEPDELRRELNALADDLDEVVLAAVDSAFTPAFAITAGMALLAGLALLPGLARSGSRGAARSRLPGGLSAGTLGGAALLAVIAVAGYAIAADRLSTEPVELADPCVERERRSVGGVEGAAEGVALEALDRAACNFGSSREELVLALFDDESRRAYLREHGVDPRSLRDLLEGVIGL